MTYKRLLLIPAISFVIAGNLFAQEVKENRQGRINLSIWKNISTQRTLPTGYTYLNAGIYSAMNRLNGVGVNIIGSAVNKDVNGVQLAGIVNMAGGNMQGVQLAGITNINGNGMKGLSFAGLVGIAGNDVRGMSFAGLTNITGDNAHGIVAGGLLNISGQESLGMHFAGLGNISGGNFKGVSAAGLLNIVGDEMQGMQLTGLMNIAGNKMKGVQLSGIANVVGGTAHGVQLSIFNMATKARGVQIGLVNYYKESINGCQLGLVNANPDTKVQLMLFGGNTTKINAGVRFKNKLFYTILGGGTHYFDFGNKFSAALFYRAGLELPIYKQWHVSADLGFQHIEAFKNKDYGVPARLYAIQARVNLEYRLNDYLGIFATGGYGGSRYYTQAKGYDKGVIAEAGVILFQY